MLVGAVATAQTTWYVNNQTGSDGRNGLAAAIPVPDDAVTGPKKTVGGAQGAVSESNAGDVIVVASTGVPYGAGTGEPGTIAFTSKRTVQSTGGEVEISSLVQINNLNAAPNNTVVFNSGSFKFSGSLTLTVGVLDNGAGLITVSGTITRAVAAATASSQLLYTGTVNYSYGATMTTANEFHASGSFNHVTTTTGNLTLKTTTSSMTGVFTTVGTLNLGGNSLTITNTAGATHAFGGNVTNGTLAFNMGGGDVTVNGAFALPTVTAATSTSTARTLALAEPTSITGTLTVSGAASVTTSAALITIGTANFSGNTVTLSGTGTVTLSGTPTTVNGNVLLSSATTSAAGSQIIFAGATTVNGNVTNSASLTVTNAATWDGATSGRITFPDLAHTISGNLVNSSTIGGASGSTLDANGFGNITFANAATNVTINGAIINSS
ncbi:MAG: beta strand repeat-containing protein, partial [Bacteroidota bacterium]